MSKTLLSNDCSWLPRRSSILVLRTEDTRSGRNMVALLPGTNKVKALPRKQPSQHHSTSSSFICKVIYGYVGTNCFKQFLSKTRLRTVFWAWVPGKTSHNADTPLSTCRPMAIVFFAFFQPGHCSRKRLQLQFLEDLAVTKSLINLVTWDKTSLNAKWRDPPHSVRSLPYVPWENEVSQVPNDLTDDHQIEPQKFDLQMFHESSGTLVTQSLAGLPGSRAPIGYRRPYPCCQRVRSPFRPANLEMIFYQSDIILHLWMLRTEDGKLFV